MAEESPMVKKLELKALILLAESELYGYTDDDEARKQIVLGQLRNWIDQLEIAGSVKEEGKVLCLAWLTEAEGCIDGLIALGRENGMFGEKERRY